MTVIKDKQTSPRLQRALEIMSGSMAWLFLIALLVLSRVSVLLAAYILIGFTFLWLVKIAGYSIRLVRGYWYMRLSQQIDWQLRLRDLHDTSRAIRSWQRRLSRQKTFVQRRASKRYLDMLERAHARGKQLLNPDDIYHIVIVATYNESPDILASTLQAVTDSRYDKSKMILAVAYEERGGPEVAANAQHLVRQYGADCKRAVAIRHPGDIPGEVKGKAGNITYAARQLREYTRHEGIPPDHTLVTTLDADNRPDPQYFAYLSYLFAQTPDRVRRSYQPIPMFFNNIWDAPTLMRVIAVSNSFWVLMESLRPHRLRNFSAHAQSLQTLVDTDYWNVQSIVEDGHQYWRTYFRYHGDHKVLPVFLPIYQDAVLADGYWRTFKAQFYQLRRWAWGVSDTPFVITKSIRDRSIPWRNKGVQIFRQLEGYFSWAAAPLVLAIGGWLPLFLNTNAEDSIIAQQLPTIVSWIQTGALLGLLAPIVSSLLSLPPRPTRYGVFRSIMMVLQWALVPVTLIGFGSMAALNAQTHLLFGKYIGEFNVTEKKRMDEPAAIKA